MKHIVPRTVTEVVNKQHTCLALADCRARPAYVLLGEPGAGKSEAMQQEADACGGRRIAARHFVVEGGGPGWQGEILFIDGMDEMRAGDGDHQTPLNKIRQKLIDLGCPSFRLSCREADWLGSSDAEDLARIAPGGSVATLHLNPLDDEQIKTILGENFKVADADAFLKKADKRGLGDLMRNPQTLELMAEAVGSNNNWPDSRAETYELACRKLVQEINPQHRHARRGSHVLEENLLHAAGYLNAVLLLAGLEGFALDAGSEDTGYFALERLTAEKAEHLEPALKTRLFLQSNEGERRRPVHRSVAEYLAARYLAEKVDRQHFSLGRILALMCGHDGGVVPQLRGLHAWLAVHCHTARHALIDSDPLGVILYGDVRNFSTTDKHRILQALSREAKSYAGFRFEDWTSHPFGALATPDMQADFRAILVSPERDEAHQCLLDCVLDALEHGQQFPDLAGDLENVVRDSTYWSGVHRTALRTLLRAKEKELERLLRLLKDIHAGLVEDPEDDLLGELLTELYPMHLPPEQIFNYLHPAKREGHVGHYLMFWHHELSASTPDAKLPVLLDRLVEIQPLHEGRYHQYDAQSMVGELLARAIEVHGMAVSDERLFDWLGVGLEEHDSVLLDREHAERVQNWLAERPECYKAVLKHGITRCSGRKEIRLCLFDSTSRLYGAKAPHDMAAWFLALSESQVEDEIAKYCFDQALFIQIPRDTCDDAVLEALEKWVSDRPPKFTLWLERYLTDELPDWRQDDALRKKKRQDEHRQRKDEWLNHFRQNLPAMRQNKVHPKVLHDLAQGYFGRLYDARGDTPHARLQQFLDNNHELIDATLDGLRNALSRDDLPTVAEIIQLDLAGQHHYIRAACLAGAEELTADNPAHILNLDDGILRRLVAFRLTYNADETPAWFTVLVKFRAELVAEILVAYALPMLKAGKKHIPLVYSLTHDQDYGAVAQHAVATLLEGFPLRARKDQLSDLEELLKAGLRYLDAEAMRKLLQARLSLTSMDAAQKVYWLGAGLVAAPQIYEQPLAQHLSRSQARARHLAEFFHSRMEPWAQGLELPVPALTLLIERLAPGSVPERPEGAHWVTAAMHTAELVRGLIQRLGASLVDDAATALERLLSLPSLAHWQSSLLHARQAQRINWRRTAFRHATVQAVETTLAGMQPASHADLMSLLMDHLRDIAWKLRDGATDNYKDFWNVDAYGRCEHPKPENECRNSLLGRLAERLERLGIDAQPEGTYADKKRADIRVWFGVAGRGINVPIEIKRDSHQDLWHAIHEQLIPRYTRDPGADGFGIYLVFWFGSKKVPAAPDGGRPPKSADELEQRLRDTIAPEDRYRIQVCVIDCACPD